MLLVHLPKAILTATGILLISAAHGQAPVVTVLLPGRNAVAAPRTMPVGITLSQPVAPASAAAVQMHSRRAGGLKAGTYTTSGNTIAFAPATPFLPGETVQVTVPATVRSTGGGGAVPHCYQFTTGVDGFGGGVFAPPVANPNLVGVASAPASLVMGDVDGDGDLDLLVGTGTAATVSVRLNSGLNSGNFVPAGTNADFSLGNPQGTARLALGDIDGDTDLDLVATTASGVVTIRVNGGVNSGVFMPTGSTFAVGSVALGLALGDVDGDGDLDVLTANAGSNTVSVRLNSGLNSGAFVGAVSTPEVAVATSPSQVLLSDLDNDGDLDFVAICGNGSATMASVRLNSGNGTFVAPATNADFSLGALTNRAVLGDLNNDGYPDLAVSHGNLVSSPTGSVETWLNSGSGSPMFSPSQTISVSRQPMELVLADVDGDGDLDLLAGNDNNTGTVSLRLNAGFGSGIFLEPIPGPEPAIGASFPWSVALGDVDGDGNLDLITANNNNSGSGSGGGSGTVSVRLNQLSGLRAVMAPSGGVAGATVMLRASDVTGASAVSFNGTPVPTGDFNVVSPTMLRAVVPGGVTTGPVTISTPRGTITSNTRFMVGGVLGTAAGRPTAGLQVYPSPGHGQLKVVVPALAGVANGQLSLLNMLGQTVWQQPVVLPANGTLVELDGAHLPAGAYLLRWQEGHHTETRRVVLD